MSLAEVHASWAWIAIGIAGSVGLWGIVLAATRRAPGRVYAVASGTAVTAMLTQVAMGIVLFNRPGGAQLAGNQHLFYGVVIAVTFTFAYVYRAQFAKRPALAWGLLLLFVMGLGIRSIGTYGQSFGG
jgi:hypothetical protein